MRASLRSFGHDASGLLVSLSREAIRSCRRMRRSPAASAMAVLSLAVAIAALGIAGRLLRQLTAPESAYRDATQLVQLYATSPASCAVCFDGFSRAELERWREGGLASLEGVSLLREVSLRPEDRRQAPVGAAYVDRGFFGLVGGVALEGRLLTEEDHATAATNAVVSEPYWRNRLGGARAAVGSTVELDGRRITIVGVLPAAFRIPAHVDLWLPASMDAASAAADFSGFIGVGRLRAGEVAQRARVELEAAARRVAATGDPLASARGATLIAYEDWPERADESSTLAVVGLAAIGLVLLCLLNVSHVVRLGAMARGREFAIRRALGASEGRLVSEIAADVLALAFVASCGSIIVYASVSRAAVTYAAAAFRMDIVILPLAQFAAVAPLLAVVIAAFLAIPALMHLRRHSGQDELRGSATSARPQQRVRGAMVFLQVTSVFVVASAATLLLRSFHETRRTVTGLDDDGSVVARLMVDPRAAGGDARRAMLTAHAAVVGMSAGSRVALWSSSKVDHFDPDRPVLFASGRGPVYSAATTLNGWLRPYPSVSLAVTPETFRVLGIEILEGRGFADSDGFGAEPVAIVNAAAAQLLWPTQSAIGQRIRLGDERSVQPWLTIVGVAENTVHLFSLGIAQHLTTQGRGPALMFRPFAQDGGADAPHMAIPARRPSAAAVWSLDEEVARILPQGVRLSEPLTPLRRWMANEPSVRRVALTAQLLSWFAAAALLVTLIGVYGLADEMVRAREREVALRRALGAPAAAVARLFGARMAGVLAMATCSGTAVAAGLSVAFERFLYGYGGAESEIRTGFAFGVSAHDPRLYFAAALCCAVMLVTGAARPIWRALRIQPAELLKGID